MTEDQARQIREFRMKGAGYKAIASVLGLSRDIVRNYCKSSSFSGYPVEVALNMEERMRQGHVCRCCGKAIQQPAMGRKRKFCSDKCRRHWWLVHPEAVRKKETALYEMVCAFCGQPFSAYGNKTRKYCSHECYVRDRFWREEEGRDRYESPNRLEEAKHE